MKKTTLIACTPTGECMTLGYRGILLRTNVLPPLTTTPVPSTSFSTEGSCKISFYTTKEGSDVRTLCAVHLHLHLHHRDSQCCAHVVLLQQTELWYLEAPQDGYPLNRCPGDMQFTVNVDDPGDLVQCTTHFVFSATVDGAVGMWGARKRSTHGCSRLVCLIPIVLHERSPLPTPTSPCQPGSIVVVAAADIRSQAGSAAPIVQGTHLSALATGDTGTYLTCVGDGFAVLTDSSLTIVSDLAGTVEKEYTFASDLSVTSIVSLHESTLLLFMGSNKLYYVRNQLETESVPGFSTCAVRSCSRTANFNGAGDVLVSRTPQVFDAATQHPLPTHTSHPATSLTLPLHRNSRSRITMSPLCRSWRLTRPSASPSRALPCR